MKRSIIFLLVLISFFAFQVFASTPQTENAPTPTEEDTMFLGLEQVSEEELVLIQGNKDDAIGSGGAPYNPEKYHAEVERILMKRINELYNIYNQLNNPTFSFEEFLQAINQGILNGAFAGAIAGFLGGTITLPGIGTITGPIAGAIIGAITGGICGGFEYLVDLSFNLINYYSKNY